MHSKSPHHNQGLERLGESIAVIREQLNGAVWARAALAIGAADRDAVDLLDLGRRERPDVDRVDSYRTALPFWI